MAKSGFYRCINRNASPSTILIVAMPSDFDQERLHYLRQAVRLGSIRGAAERLNVNPSTVSRQIALLEKQVSTTLLERYGRRSPRDWRCAGAPNESVFRTSVSDADPHVDYIPASVWLLAGDHALIV